MFFCYISFPGRSGNQDLKLLRDQDLDLKKVEIRKSAFLDFLRSGSGRDQEIKPPPKECDQISCDLVICMFFKIVPRINTVFISHRSVNKVKLVNASEYITAKLELQALYIKRIEK